MYHDGYADGYERAEAAAGTALDVPLLAKAIRKIAKWEVEDWLLALDKGDEADAIAAEYARLLEGPTT
jgi:hypothetical protein